MARWIVIFAAICAAAVSAGPVLAQVSNFAKICGDPKSSARDVVHFCQKALDTGDLNATAEAQVRANRAIGLFEMGRLSEAVDENSRAIALLPNLIPAYLNRARAHERQGNLQAAIADYAAVLRLDPRDADAFLGRGALLLRNGDPGRAAADLGEALRLRPGDVSAHFNRGIAFARLGDFAKAEVDFSAVIARDAQDAAAFMRRGEVRAALGRGTALADLNNALALAPDWAAAWFARGRYWDGQKNREAANADFLRAYELGYQDTWLTKRIREISG